MSYIIQNLKFKAGSGNASEVSVKYDLTLDGQHESELLSSLNAELAKITDLPVSMLKCSDANLLLASYDANGKWYKADLNLNIGLTCGQDVSTTDLDHIFLRTVIMCYKELAKFVLSYLDVPELIMKPYINVSTTLDNVNIRMTYLYAA